MPNCKTVVPYRGSPEQEERLRQVIAEHRGQPGATMPVLQAAQEIFGYLPKEVLIEISNQLDVPVSQIFGVVTFYAQFHLEPRGKNIVRSCQGTACHVRGAKGVLNAIREKLGLRSCVEPVCNIRGLNKHDMVRNGNLPKIEVDPETFAVKVDGVHATVKPAQKVALGQLYFFS